MNAVEVLVLTALPACPAGPPIPPSRVIRRPTRSGRATRASAAQGGAARAFVENLVPVLRTVHQNDLNPWWRKY
jgi:hypothetical protein